jgi:hypothetical protein
MSTVAQQSNSRVMTQKVDKAKRLLEEVKRSIEIRGKTHELWNSTKTHVEAGIDACQYSLDCLEAVTKYNKEVEARRI